MPQGSKKEWCSTLLHAVYAHEESLVTLVADSLRQSIDERHDLDADARLELLRRQVYLLGIAPLLAHYIRWQTLAVLLLDKEADSTYSSAVQTVSRHASIMTWTQYDALMRSTDDLDVTLGIRPPRLDDQVTAMHELLAALPLCNATGWYFDVVLALRRANDVHVNTIVRYEVFVGEYGAYERWLGTRSRSATPKEEEMPPMVKREELDRQTLYALLDAYSPPSISPSYKHARAYQLELTSVACTGRNVVACAPTGSGKTVAAAHLAEHVLQLRGRRARVVMIVPTCPLVDQQTAVLTQQLGHMTRVTAIQAGEVQRAKAFLSHGCCVMTAQIFINLLTSPVDRVLWSDIDLLIVDECHHTAMQHPYNVLMAHYAASVDCARPQVFGMTASVSTSSSTGGIGGVSGACHRIYTLLVNMACTHLATVHDNATELSAHTNRPFDQLKLCSPDYLQHRLFGAINALAAELSAALLQPLRAQLTSDSSLTLKHKPECLLDDTQPFMQWTNGWLQHLQKTRHSGEEEDEKYMCIRRLQALKLYCYAVELLMHVPPRFAQAWLTQEMNEVFTKSKKSFDKSYICQPFSSAVAQLGGEGDKKSNALTTALVKVVTEEMRRLDDWRCLVFVRTRAMAQLLCECVNDMSLPFKAAYITSQNASRQLGGQTAVQQQTAIKKFREGSVRLLFATSVAEEGLDIQACSCIVNYNLSSSAIGRVQKTGRARAMDSRSVLLAASGRVLDAELTAINDAKLMNEAVQYIRTQGEAQLQVNLRAVAQEQDVKHGLEEEEDRALLRSMAGKSYTLQCIQCEHSICPSTSIRLMHGTHYVCVDPQFWHRHRLYTDDDMPSYSLMTCAGRVECGRCGVQTIGRVNVYGDQLWLPSINASAIALREDGGTTLATCKQWKQIRSKYFPVAAISAEEQEVVQRAIEGARERNDSLRQMNNVYVMKQLQAMCRAREEAKVEHDVEEEKERQEEQYLKEGDVMVLTS